MDKSLSTILGADVLPTELMTQLEEAFSKKVAEARVDAEQALREEFARRYENDKANLVEAIDRMLGDVVKTYEGGKVSEMKKLGEARAKYHRAVKEAKQYHKTKLDEQATALKTTGVKKIAEEIKSVRAQKQKFISEQKRLERAYEGLKEEMAASQAARLKKIDEFVVRSVGRELKEFSQDHRALIETRIKLVTESKKKLKETQARFVKEAARKAEAVINESLKREMTQLHEDLERNRQNMFGRRIFEAVAAEFMTSYLAEGSEVRKVQKTLEATQKKLAETTARLDETTKAATAAQRKIKLAEDTAARTKILGELLSNLRGDKRSVMESMLATTKTEQLRSTFDRLLPVVLSETSGRKTPATKVLSETAKPERRIVTGDRANRLMESNTTDSEIENELAQVVRLAGIQK